MALSAGVGEDNWLAGNVALAYHYGLEMRAYEGGPDTSGPNLGQEYLTVKGNATVDPRMQSAVTTYLQNWCDELASFWVPYSVQAMPVQVCLRRGHGSAELLRRWRNKLD